jgi:hypothetical protein
MPSISTALKKRAGIVENLTDYVFCDGWRGTVHEHCHKLANSTKHSKVIAMLYDVLFNWTKLHEKRVVI